MARVRLVAGNWKMHGSRAANAALLDALVKDNPSGCAVRPLPLSGAGRRERLRGSPIGGAQNVSEHAQGAYTGEVSAAMLAEFGCRYVIVGHSERRQLYGESDAQAAAKFAAVKARGHDPIFCVGKRWQNATPAHQAVVGARSAGKEFFRECGAGLRAGLGDRHRAQRDPEQAQAVHAFLRKKVPADTPILYGGSVKPQNAAAIFAMPDVDGGLIGGASLVAKDFLDIVKAAGK